MSLTARLTRLDTGRTILVLSRGCVGHGLHVCASKSVCLKQQCHPWQFCTQTAVDVSRIDVAFSTSAGHIITSYKLTGYTLLCDNIDYALQCIQTNKKPKKTIALPRDHEPNTPPRAVSPPAPLVLHHSSKPSTPAKARLHPSQYTPSYGIAVKQS